MTQQFTPSATAETIRQDLDFPVLAAVNEYGFYCIPKAYAHREVPKALLDGAVYEPNTLRLLRRVAGDGDVITGGAFIGDFLPALAQALVPGATLHTFEPVPLSFAAAQQTLRLNRLSNVVLHPCAVGESDGTLHLQVVANNGEPMAARAKVVNAPITDRTVEVPVVRIDDLVAPSRKVSILHLDLEGHEGPALLGARRMIEQNRPVIVLESEKAWEQRAYQAQLNEAFPDLGYRLSGMMERNSFYLASD